MLVAGALILGLVACGKNNPGGGGGNGNGGNGDNGTTVTPVLTDAYNPDPSATESTDPRVPYKGDWVWVAKLPDGSYQQGVMTISERGQPTDQAKNGGFGSNSTCANDTCTTPTNETFAVVLSQVTNSGAQLRAILGSRLTMTDSDNKVTLNAKGRPVMSGAGTWEPTSQTAKVAFVQVDTNPDKSYGTVLSDVFTQAKTAADQVTAQRVQSLPSLDLDSILK
ncbi:hypothetical protein DAETH_10790 [Deinococcus aetherius]|uniref:Lipoprotein n=2 Tax=Deinococcus aetherius TaxID=200252 RepID=A0ABN6RCL6_9DEIO|nr:hypothetical protein DAETH_10790 [Deinococcus aetherius]